MKNSFVKVYNLRISLRLFIKLIAYTLLIGIASEIIAYFDIQPSIAPAEAQLISQTNAQRLVGRWQGKDTLCGPSGTYIFTADNKLYILRQASNGVTNALQSFYKINSSTRPMQLEVIDTDGFESQKSSFQFTDQGELRLDFSDVTGCSPANFSAFFEKVSNIANLPPNTEIIKNTAPTKALQSEAKTYIGAMVRAQQAYYIENGKFARTIDQLRTGIESETKNYRYRVIPQGNGTQRVMMTAVSRHRILKSYTGAVFTLKINGTNKMVPVICETNKPSLSPPVLPKITNNPSGQIQCPAGSTRVN
ncbi:type IV pilin-like G/H family protein [Nodularia sphaerocarpa]|uniref:type IV pilin-like G/H family protein n=1 Tax=Nodularia sphaerocarpa TaxID=137816 RepID=UPI001EFA8F6E|nr:type IV pilin-like G/H family protein [Nodularia sphaerocarpa]MDB9373196.1 type IV pilin-like G/H family protein [Nodularia sphaerocarpa CS-585]MDB9378284.1 type IV pilin-like G/H family protein [Nodularia sphaerocarpa CS-585A2]ULP70643.1 hypothetical protein BDGGKGIB_00259 [Nodularia sphaerocarpa UHCC 0038]